MPLLPHGSYRKTRGIIRRGTRANQPAANTVLEGTLYYVTDEELLERSTGAAWQSYSWIITATSIAAGTLADARLSSNVPLKNVAEAISGVWDFSNGLKERGRSTAIGIPIDIAYDSGNFVASTGSWTVAEADQVTFCYTLIGKTLVLWFELHATSVSNNCAYLQFPVPGGFTVARTTRMPIAAVNNSVIITTAIVYVPSGTTVIQIYPDTVGGSQWTASTNATYVQGQVFLPIQ